MVADVSYLVLFLLLIGATDSMSTMANAPGASRAPSVRSNAEFLSSVANGSDDDGDLLQLAGDMVERTGSKTPLTSQELEDCLNSMKNVLPADGEYDWANISSVLTEVCHVSHKDWELTEANSIKLNAAYSGDGSPFLASTAGQQLMERVFVEGNTAGAVKQAASMPIETPTWTVLVTGVNGIRKTTSLYQPWFPKLLSEALVSPPDAAVSYPLEQLPTGRNSFFRQLDHIIATVCNQHFGGLYRMAQVAMEKAGVKEPSEELVQAYSTYKAGIFARYRTLSELWGVLLVRYGQSQKWNVLLETSGKDVAMFHYIDHLCKSRSDPNCKLALHFEINDLDLAKGSVDARMVHEIHTGIGAISKSAMDCIYANAGGPYGSDVLEGVQKASDEVWNEKVIGQQAQVGSDWYKATIRINAHSTEPWTACAILPDGRTGTVFEFEDIRTKSK